MIRREHVFVEFKGEATLYIKRKRKFEGYYCKKCKYNHIRPSKSKNVLQSIWFKHKKHALFEVRSSGLFYPLGDVKYWFLDIWGEEDGILDVLFQHGLTGRIIHFKFPSEEFVPDYIVMTDNLPTIPREVI